LTQWLKPYKGGWKKGGHRVETDTKWLAICIRNRQIGKTQIAGGGKKSQLTWVKLHKKASVQITNRSQAK